MVKYNSSLLHLRIKHKIAVIFPELSDIIIRRKSFPFLILLSDAITRFRNEYKILITTLILAKFP